MELNLYDALVALRLLLRAMETAMASDNPVFEASYCRLFNTPVVGVVGDGDEQVAFFDLFYRLFLRQPGVSRFFAQTDMTRQKHMLKSSLFELTTCWALGRPSAELMRIANVHKHLKIDRSVLDLWFDTLLDTVRDMDPEYNEMVRLAWMAALGPGMFFVKSILADAETAGSPESSGLRWYSGPNDPAGRSIQ